MDFLDNPNIPPPLPGEEKQSFLRIAPLSKTLSRFPITCGLILIWLILTELSMLTGEGDLVIADGCYPAILLSLAIYIINEIKAWSEKTNYLLQGGALLIGLTLLLTGYFCPSEWVHKAANCIEGAACAAIFFPPVRRMPLLWRFASIQLASAVLCIIAMFAIIIPTTILLTYIGVKIYAYLEFFIFGLSYVIVAVLAAVVFLGRVPLSSDLTEDKVEFRIIKWTGLYILTPLLGVILLLIVSYIYQSLRVGALYFNSITNSAAIWCAGMFLVMFSLLPRRHKLPEWLRTSVYRGLPIFSILLLLFMEWMLYKQIVQEGVTDKTISSIAAGAWGILVFCGIAMQRIRNLQLIPWSFAALLLLLALIPPIEENNVADVDNSPMINEAGDEAQASESPANDYPVLEDDDNAKGSMNSFKHRTLMLSQPAGSPTLIPSDAGFVLFINTGLNGLIKPDEKAELKAGNFSIELPLDSLCKLDEYKPMRPFNIPSIESGASFTLTRIEIIEYSDAYGKIIYRRVAYVSGYLFTRKKIIRKKKS